MNAKQKIVIAIAAIAIAGTFLYVPWRTYVPLDTPQGNIAETRSEYRLFNSPPDEPLALKPPQIVWAYSVQTAGLILVANGVLLYLLRTKRQNRQSMGVQTINPQAAF
jgi:hypothetical protein